MTRVFQEVKREVIARLEAEVLLETRPTAAQAA